MRQILAADIGGSKTLINIYDMNDNAVYTHQTDGCGYAVESDSDIPHLSKLLRKISKKHDICSIAVNLGGKNKEQLRRIFSEIFKNIPLSIFRESEGTAAIEYGKKRNASVVLLAGTGVIAVGQNHAKGLSCISGGWGANISDIGSGYWIGLESIKYCLNALDGTKPLADFVKKVTGRDRALPVNIGTEEICALRDEARKGLTPYDRKTIAAYTRVAAEFCEKGDPFCKEIFEKAGEQMGLLASNTAKKLELCEVNGIAVTGGLVNIKRHWQKQFEKTVSKNIKINNFSYDIDGVIIGTYEIAKKQLEL